MLEFYTVKEPNLNQRRQGVVLAWFKTEQERISEKDYNKFDALYSFLPIYIGKLDFTGRGKAG